MLRAERLCVAADGIRRQALRLTGDPFGTQIYHKVGCAAEGQRMIGTEKVAQSSQRVLAQPSRLMRPAQLGKIAGEICGDGKRIVVVAGDPRVEACEGGLVQFAGTGGVTSHSPQ